VKCKQRQHMMMLMIMVTSSIRLLVQSILCSTLPEHVYILNRCFLVRTPCAVGALLMNTPEFVCQCLYSSRCHRIPYFAHREGKYTSQIFVSEPLRTAHTVCKLHTLFSEQTGIISSVFVTFQVITAVMQTV